jgi:hypothetical protein
MAAILFLLEPYSFLLSGLAGVLVYAILLWATRAITPEEITSLFQKEAKSPLSSAERIETLVP